LQLSNKLDAAKSVRLATEYERYPDGFVTSAGKTLKVEVTEAISETRRRGDEYKFGKSPSDPAEEDADVIETELERVIQKKIKKKYKPKPMLDRKRPAASSRALLYCELPLRVASQSRIMGSDIGIVDHTGRAPQSDSSSRTAIYPSTFP
jgi:hypothetical protein